MVSIPEVFTNNSLRYPITPTPVNNPSSIKSLYLFTNILDVKNKTDIRQVRAVTSKRKAIKAGTNPLAMRKTRNENSKINNQIKESLYNWVMHYPQVVQSPIFNYDLKVNIDGPTRLKIVPKLILQVSVRELHNSLVSEPECVGLKEARDA